MCVLDGFVVQIFIDNEWHKSESGKTFPTVNPANGKVITEIQEGDRVRTDFFCDFCELSYFLVYLSSYESVSFVFRLM